MVQSFLYNKEFLSLQIYSIAATNITGNDIDLNTIAIIKNIAIIEAALTFLKSVSAILIKSFVRGASPPTRPSGSYLWTICSTSVNCALHSSELLYILNLIIFLHILQLLIHLKFHQVSFLDLLLDLYIFQVL